MINKFQELVKTIDLNNYSSSLSWCGYLNLESKNDIVVDGFISQIVNIFYKYDFLLAIDYNIWFDSEQSFELFENKWEDFNAILQPLVVSGIINMPDPVIASKFNFDNNAEGVDSILKIILQPEPSIIKSLLTIIFKYYGLQGHVFIYFPLFNAILYPHDSDLGVGMFSLNDQSKELFSDMLSEDKFFTWHKKPENW